MTLIRNDCHVESHIIHSQCFSAATLYLRQINKTKMTNHVAATQFIYAYGLGQEDLL